MATETDPPDPCETVPTCPICRIGPMRLARRMERITVCVCMTCETTLSVPNAALERFRRESAGS